MDRTEPRPRRRADGEELQQALAGWLDRDRIESARGAVRALGEQETNPRDTEARLLEVAADAPPEPALTVSVCLARLACVKTAHVKFETRQDRPRFLSTLFAEYLRGRVLDVGCDRAVLREFIGPERYTGIDISPEADIQQDLQATGKLPFEDRSWDTVVCTDVLEHLENLHAIFDELVRVADRYLLITLPNNWNSARQRLRRGKGAIAHYGLPLEPPVDRHRWFFSLEEAEGFFRGQAERAGLEIVELLALEKPRHAAMRGLRRLTTPSARRYRNLYAHTLVCVYRRPGEPQPAV